MTTVSSTEMSDEKQKTHPSALTARTVKIGLLSPFGASNLGDLATQQAMMQNIRAYFPNSKIYGFSLNPRDTELRYGIPSYPITRLGEIDEWWLGENPNRFSTTLYKIVQRLRSISHPLLKKLLFPAVALSALILEALATLRAYRNLKGLDLLIASGGGQLDDYWWGARFHPYTLFLWSTLAKLRGVKFAFVSVGAGPIDESLSKLFIRYALNCAAYRSYRDEDSKQYIEYVVGFKKNDPVYPDLAHSLQLDKYSQSLIPKSSQPVIGINPMPPYNPKIGLDEISYRGYLNKLATFIPWLIQKGYKVCLYANCIQGDTPAIRDLKQILTGSGKAYSDDQLTEASIQSVDDLMSYISTFDMAVATRFHGVLLPLLSNKPVLAISYHRKIDMLMADVGQSEYCVLIDQFDVETLKERFTLLEANFEISKKQINHRIQEYRAALKEQYSNLFRSLV